MNPSKKKNFFVHSNQHIKKSTIFLSSYSFSNIFYTQVMMFFTLSLSFSALNNKPQITIIIIILYFLYILERKANKTKKKLINATQLG